VSIGDPDLRDVASSMMRPLVSEAGIEIGRSLETTEWRRYRSLAVHSDLGQTGARRRDRMFAPSCSEVENPHSTSGVQRSVSASQEDVHLFRPEGTFAVITKTVPFRTCSCFLRPRLESV